MSVGRRKRWQVLERDNFTCRYCGRSVPDVVLEVDHVVSRFDGGSDLEDNLVTSCFDCNQGKKTLSAREALDFMGWFKDARDEADKYFSEALRSWERTEALERAREVLVHELAYRTQQTEGDIWDWLSEEMAS